MVSDGLIRYFAKGFVKKITVIAPELLDLNKKKSSCCRGNKYHTD